MLVLSDNGHLLTTRRGRESEVGIVHAEAGEDLVSAHFAKSKLPNLSAKNQKSRLDQSGGQNPFYAPLGDLQRPMLLMLLANNNRLFASHQVDSLLDDHTPLRLHMCLLKRCAPPVDAQRQENAK